MPASIRDVARKAGVSIGTVSRALNGYRDISEETRLRIKKVAEEMGYVPTLSASTLSSKNRKNIAMIFSGLLDEKTTTNEFEMLLIKGAYEYAFKNNLEFASYVIDSELQKKKTYEQFCREHSLSGALLFGLKTTDSYCSSLPDSPLPCVTVDITVPGEHVGNVVVDNIAAFQELTEYLIHKNHRNFVIVHGRKNTMVSMERLAGAYQAMEEHGIRLTKDQIIYTNFEEEKAYGGVKKYLKSHNKDDTTAFICMSDMTAIGTIRAIREMGYRIPEDFSVVGYDAIYASRFTHPPLTTVDQKVQQKGYYAAKLLHDMLNGKATERRIVLQHELVYRGSVREVRQA